MPSQEHRIVLARSLRCLMKATRITAPQLAKRADVDPKTVNNMIHGRFGASIDSIEKVARVFNLEPWELLMPGYVDANATEGKNLAMIIAAYFSTDDTGRHSIAAVAEMAARVSRPEA